MGVRTRVSGGLGFAVTASGEGCAEEKRVGDNDLGGDRDLGEGSEEGWDTPLLCTSQKL